MEKKPYQLRRLARRWVLVICTGALALGFWQPVITAQSHHESAPLASVLQPGSTDPAGKDPSGTGRPLSSLLLNKASAGLSEAAGQPAAPPNLVPYTVPGWDGPLVPASIAGTNTLNTLYAAQPTFIDFALINTGGNTSTNFDVCLYLDTTSLQCWTAVGGLNSGYYLYVTDYIYVAASAGTHTLRLVVDSANTVAESNEADNTYQHDFTWLSGTAGCYYSASPSRSSPAVVQASPSAAAAAQAASRAIPAGVQRMPPSPDLIEALKSQGYSSITILDLTKTPAAVDAPQQVPMGPVIGTKKALILLVAFPNWKMNNLAQPSFYNNLLFSVGAYPAPGSMRDFYRANSYGLFDVQGATGACSVAPHASDYYARNDGVHNMGLGPYPTNAQGLVVDAVNAANAAINFADYAVGGSVEGLFIVHAGQGAETNYPSDLIWSHSWGLSDTSSGSPGPLSVDGVVVDGYTMEPEYSYTPGDSTIGVFTHEYGHALGLPDLYDTDYISAGIGRWSLMSGGSWNGIASMNGSSPADLDAWSKVQLGWITPTTLSAPASGVTVTPSETNALAYKLKMNGAGAGEYFLLENRQLTGFDAALPGSGLLIWHIDDAKSDNTGHCAQNNNWLCGSNHAWVALEQADGLFQLENYANSGDSADPFPGSSNNHAFTLSSSPNSSSYASASDTLVRVQNITVSGNNILADLAGPYAVSCFTLNTAANPAAGGSVSSGAGLNCLGDPTRYSGGTVVQLTATANSGFGFLNWSGDLTGTTNPVQLVLNGDQSVTANFTACYTLTTAANPNASGAISAETPPNCPGDPTRYSSGTIVQLTPTASSGFGFLNWSNDLTGTTNPGQVTMNADRSVTANFTPHNPLPVLTGLEPASAPAGSPGFTLKVAGSNYISGSIIRWNGSDLTTTYTNAGELTAVVDAGKILAAGAANITVYTPGPGGGETASMKFSMLGDKKTFIPAVKR